MKIEDYKLHITELDKIDSLLKQIEYWCEHLTQHSLLRPLKNKNEIFHLKFDNKNPADTKILLEKEMDRLDYGEFYNPRSESILNSFYARYETDSSDLEFLKKQAIKEINNIVNWELDDLKFIKRGFEAYKGGDSIDIKLEDLSFIFQNVKDTENFKYIYEGYLLAMAQREIEASQGKRNQITISTNYLGLVIYAFDLDSNAIFSNLKMGATEKAKFFAKIFNIGDSQVENLRKAISSPEGKVSKPFLKWFKQFGIDPKDTQLKKYLPK